MNRYITIVFAILLAAPTVLAQKEYHLKLSTAQLEIEGETLEGFQTDFDFLRESVRYGWWKYAKSFGSPTDMREYYMVKIPYDRTDGNQDILIYTQTVENGDKADFLIAAREYTYKEQVKEILLDFKRSFHIDYYVGLIDELGKEASAHSQEYSKTGNVASLRALLQIEAKINDLKNLLKRI